MKYPTAIGRALDAVRSSNPFEATRLIQVALRGCEGPGGQTSQLPFSTPQPPSVLDSAGFRPDEIRRQAGLGATVPALRSFKLPLDVDVHRAKITLPESLNFKKRHFACANGQRDFRLFVPACNRPRGLIVMLHGCRQTAEDFAVGTNMNVIAEENELLVAYPYQPSSANSMSCWNWFRPQDQERLRGEPALIAHLTRELCVEFEVPRENVFAAGLSAGGAMAAVLGSAYPDMYAAIGIHSGLPYKSAHDVNSAFAAMRGENRNHFGPSLGEEFRPRLIVFHGNSDATVDVANAALLWRSAVRSRGPGDVIELTVSAGGREVDRRIFSTSDDAASVEEWIIHGSGHAWSGGNPRGSYTAGDGPNASAEMVRFFMAGHQPSIRSEAKS